MCEDKENLVIANCQLQRLSRLDFQTYLQEGRKRSLLHQFSTFLSLPQKGGAKKV